MVAARQQARRLEGRGWELSAVGVKGESCCGCILCRGCSALVDAELPSAGCASAVLTDLISRKNVIKGRCCTAEPPSAASSRGVWSTPCELGPRAGSNLVGFFPLPSNARLHSTMQISAMETNFHSASWNCIPRAKSLPGQGWVSDAPLPHRARLLPSIAPLDQANCFFIYTCHPAVPWEAI